MYEVFNYPVTILERHLDTFGHVNNAIYLQILEEARWAFIHPHGFGVKEIQKTGVGPTIVEINIKFLKELRLRQNVIVKSQSEPFKGRIGTLRQWIEDESGTIFCDAHMKVGLFDIKLRKLILPTADWLKAIGKRD